MHAPLTRQHCTRHISNKAVAEFKISSTNVECIGANLCYISLYHLKSVQLRGLQEKDSIFSGGYCPQLQKGEVTEEAVILDATYKIIKRTVFSNILVFYDF